LSPGFIKTFLGWDIDWLRGAGLSHRKSSRFRWYLLRKGLLEKLKLPVCSRCRGSDVLVGWMSCLGDFHRSHRRHGGAGQPSTLCGNVDRWIVDREGGYCTYCRGTNVPSRNAPRIGGLKTYFGDSHRSSSHIRCQGQRSLVVQQQRFGRDIFFDAQPGDLETWRPTVEFLLLDTWTP
jgi:hypothetical protein